MSTFLPLLALAVAPALAIGIFVYWKDKFDKEPILIMSLCFFFGMLSIIPAIFLENIPEKLGFNDDRQSMQSTLITAFLFTALVEESCKFFFLRIYAYPKRDFNEPFDGITYAVMVSLGFATLENIQYVLRGGYEVAILRMFTAVPAHATFGVIMGYFAGLAKFRDNKKSYLLLALISAVAMHGCYDFFLMQQLIPGLYFGAIASLVIGIFLSLKAIKLHSQEV